MYDGCLMLMYVVVLWDEVGCFVDIIVSFVDIIFVCQVECYCEEVLWFILYDMCLLQSVIFVLIELQCDVLCVLDCEVLFVCIGQLLLCMLELVDVFIDLVCVEL